MDTKIHLAIGELVQAAAHLHGLTGPVQFTACRPQVVLSFQKTMSEKVLVKLWATVWTDGNPEDVRKRYCKAVMDRNLIVNAESQAIAIKNFMSAFQHINEVVEFHWFEIGDNKYAADHWNSG